MLSSASRWWRNNLAQEINPCKDGNCCRPSFFDSYLRQMLSLAVKRCLAFLADYSLMAIYAGILIVLFRNTSDVMDPLIDGSAITAQIIGFVLLTLPVLLYFILSESSKYQGSFGKRLMKIKVVNPDKKGYRIIVRNLIKFLPWEIAHAGIYQTIYADPSINPHTSTILLLTVPQVVVMAYVLSIFAGKGRTAIYDSLAGTSVQSSDLTATN
jgi:uncharacterized RDD family membrane protein YckC